MTFKDQIVRIKKKLKQAKAKDKHWKVFGATEHFYKLGVVVTDQEVTTFEQTHNVTLPPCYKAFLTQIGDSGAGPFYGLYDLAITVETYCLNDAEVSLQLPVQINQSTTRQQWDVLTKQAVQWDWNKPFSNQVEENAHEESYYTLSDQIYGGILPIGYQGCTNYHGLILNGSEAGHVVYIDDDFSQPFFTYEANFLDWYERWLDEILSGFLMRKKAFGFGYFMGGNIEELFRVYQNSPKDELKQEDALIALTKQDNVPLEIVQALVPAYNHNNKKIRHAALSILVQNHPNICAPVLTQYLEHSPADSHHATNLILKHKIAIAPEWFQICIKNLKHISEDFNQFNALCNLLELTKKDYSETLLPFCQHQNPEFRANAIQHLAEMDNNERFFECFKQGLLDPEKYVIERTTWATNSVDDKRLRPYYEALFEKFEIRYAKEGFQEADNNHLYQISKWLDRNGTKKSSIFKKIERYQALWMEMVTKKRDKKKEEERKIFEEIEQDPSYQKEIEDILNDVEEEDAVIQQILQDEDFMKLLATVEEEERKKNKK